MLIKNNLIAIAIHACICCILFFPIQYMWWGGVWFDRMWNDEFKYIIYRCLAIGICTIVALVAYFFAGRHFLQNTGNMQANIFSVLALVGILIIAILLKYAGIWYGILNTPFYPIGATISYFLRIEENHVFLAMTVLPSLIMWLGLMSKKI